MRSIITEAIRHCVCEWPRLATSLLRIDPRPKEGIETMALDEHLRLYYDPEWVKSASFDNIVFSIKQDLVHCLLDHSGRSQAILGDSEGAVRNYIQDQLNIAADCASHYFLSAERQEISDDAVQPRKIKSVKTGMNLTEGLSLEQYFLHLYDRDLAQTISQAPELHDRGRGGQGRGGQGPLETGGRKTGSSGDGEKRPWEDEFKEPSLGEKEDDTNPNHHGVGPDEIDDLGEEFISGSSAGSGSEGSSRGSKPVKPRVSPAQLLRMAVRNGLEKRTHGHEQPTYRRQSRRRYGGELVHPSYQKFRPNLTIVVDTSASMRQSDINLASGMIEVALKGMDLGEVHVVAADWSVCWEDEVTDVKDVQLKGGGGTRMNLVCDEIANRKKAPDLLICVTDGETQWPTSRKVPMVAAITRKSEYGGDIPDHIKMIEIYDR